MASRNKGMRISELARRSGTSRETIHFYLREGLLTRPEKTSRNMAYYDERHVAQLALIKKLRTESYLPLAAIKKVLAEGDLGARARHLDLSAELFGRGARTDVEPLTRAQLAARTEVSEARLERYEGLGLLRPEAGPDGPRYGHAELRAVELLVQAERDGGAGNEDLMLERLELVEKHMRALVEAEVAHFFSRVVSEGDPARVLKVLEGGRETIGRYMGLARGRHLRREVDAMLPALQRDREARPGEPFLFGIPEGVRVDQGEAQEQSRLQKAARAGRAAAHRALVRHLQLTAQPERLLEALEAAPPKVRGDLESALARADGLMQLERWDEAFEALEAVRESRAPDPRLEARWGAVVLVRIRERFKTLESSHELVGLLSRAFAAFEAARTVDASTPLEVVRVHLLLGRIGVAAPAFLGTKPQARLDLERARAALDTLGDVDPDVAPPELRPLAFGGYAWLDRNVDAFLAQARA